MIEEHARGQAWKGHFIADHPTSKAVVQIDHKGKKLGTWGSMKAAANFYKTDLGNISKAAAGKRKTAKGFKWVYKYPILQKVIQYDKNDVKLKEWRSMRTAIAQTGIKSAKIIKCCEGEMKYAGGFIWKYS